MTTFPTAKEVSDNPLSHLGYGELLTTFMAAKDTSARQFAARASIARGRLVKIQTGRADPTPDELVRISDAMKTYNGTAG